MTQRPYHYVLKTGNVPIIENTDGRVSIGTDDALETQMNESGKVGYDDGGVVCTDQDLLIRRYYPWGAKRIPYSAIKGVTELPLQGASRVRRWRIWGSGDFIHWWNFDSGRTYKELALVIDVGHRVRPTITPDDPAAVAGILRAQLGST
jgi:hypothetical protein